MGTDIHAVLEVKVDGVWKRSEVPGFGERSYNAFAILANVRNGNGFAGVVTGEPISPISRPRGLPDDYERRFDDENNFTFGEHSFSWVTAKELLDFDWDQVRTSYGVVTPFHFKEAKEKGKPSEWSGDVGGGNVIMIDQSEMADRIERNDWKLNNLNISLKRAEHQETAMRYGWNLDWEPPKNPSFHTRISWKEPLKEYANLLYDWVQTDLSDLAEEYGAENVRMVFGFDS